MNGMSWLETWAMLGSIWMIIGLVAFSLFATLLVAGAVNSIREKKRK